MPTFSAVPRSGQYSAPKPRRVGQRRFSAPPIKASVEALRTPAVRFEGAAKEYILVTFDAPKQLEVSPFRPVFKHSEGGEEEAAYVVSDAVKQIANFIAKKADVEDTLGNVLDVWSGVPVGDAEKDTAPRTTAISSGLLGLNALVVAAQAAITRLLGDYELRLYKEGIEPSRALLRHSSSARDARALSVLFNAIARPAKAESRRLSVDPDNL